VRPETSFRFDVLQGRKSLLEVWPQVQQVIARRLADQVQRAESKEAADNFPKEPISLLDLPLAFSSVLTPSLHLAIRHRLVHLSPTNSFRME
jgi:hypothetical protein